MSKILIADDREENRYLLEAILRGRSHQVVSAANGSEALELARLETPDLIVADILMPVMDGFALCRECKSDTALAGIPFVFYTATYTNQKDRELGLSLGAERYLLKPLDPEDLMKILTDVMEEASHGRLKPSGQATKKENGYFREYSEALSRKLEEKMAELEQVNQSLRRELSEKKQAEIRLRRLYAAIENAAECIAIIDIRGSVEYVNPAFERITGLTKDRALSFNPDVSPPGDGDEPFWQGLWQVISESDPWTGQLTKKNPSGETLELDVTMSPIPNGLGVISGFVLVMRDVTGQRILEDQLFQSQKIEALGTLAGGIAHDFNNVLGAIVGYTDLSLFEAAPESRMYKNLKAIHHACDRAKNLVKQILSFSRKAEHKIKTVDLRPILEETVNFLSATLPANIEIRCSLEPADAFVLADPVQIHQVIINLGANAAYAMREKGGVLDVRLKKTAPDESMARQYPSLAGVELLSLSMSDTGCGMSKEVLGRIFEPFYTTKKEGEGTGLGLSLAHTIIKNHGGFITAHSEEGCGAAFNICLPLAKGAHKEPDGVDASQAPLGTERILFVDDEEVLTDIGEQVLSRLGYRVTATTSSVEALRLFQDDPEAFDLLITDHAMPHLTGRELAGEVFKMRPEMPIIMCTGFSVGAENRKSIAPSVRRILLKPLLIKDLAQAVRSALDASS